MDAVAAVKSPTHPALAISAQPLRGEVKAPEQADSKRPVANAAGGKPTQVASQASSPAKVQGVEANESARVSLSRQNEPQPNTADRNAKPIEQFKAVSALR